jgi:hypothetical protein
MMTGLVLLGVGLVQATVLASVWCVWDVATTEGFLLELEGRSKRRWLAIVLLPLVGPAWWIEGGRPPADMAPLVPRGGRFERQVDGSSSDG